MTETHSPPSIRPLRAERFAQRKQHLLLEITRAQPAVGQTDTPWAVFGNHSARRLLAAAAVLAVVAGAVGVLVTREGTGTASAAEVRAKLAQALRFQQSVSGEFSVQTRSAGTRPRNMPGCQNCLPPLAPRPTKFVIGSDGSYASLTLPRDAKQRDDIAYDASTGVETSISTDRFRDLRTGRPLFIRAFNLDPASITYGPEARIDAWVLGALSSGNPDVRNTALDGRPAWKLTASFVPGESLAGLYGVRVDVVIDKATGLVLQITQYAYSPKHWTSIETVHNLKLGASTSAADFTVPKPAGSVAITHDFHFQRVPTSSAAAIVGYKPLLASDTVGRKLSDFAVAKTTNLAPPGFPFPPFHDVVSARYGDGPTSVTVSTRRGRLNELLTNIGLGSARPLNLTGLLKGDYAYVSTDPLRRTLLAAFHHGLLVQITAPSPRDAIRTATSLHAAP